MYKVLNHYNRAKVDIDILINVIGNVTRTNQLGIQILDKEIEKMKCPNGLIFQLDESQLNRIVVMIL